MIHRILLLFLLSAFSSVICGQSVVSDSLASLFRKQLMIFPQEKIHLHTDKPYYISGEKIWFRAHLVDAMSHIPSSVSRYVYVELINPLDSVVTRVKIRPENDAYYGYLLIPDDAPEGDYTMRAYTTFMRSQDEHYFCAKPIHISDPQARMIQTETQFTFESGRRIHVTFRFSDVSLSTPLVPQSVKVSVNDGRLMNAQIDNDGTAGIKFNLSAASRKRVILLEVMTHQTPYRQYIRIPQPDDDFDVAFFPEGGSLMQGVACKIALKALNSNGQSINITGAVYDQTGFEIQEIKTDYLGMGNFSHFAEKDKTYYAICTNDKGESKRFDLPNALDRGYALSVSQVKGRIFVTVLKPAECTQDDELYLLAHTRGMVQLVGLWDFEKNMASFQREQFPSGVLHFILFDAALNPVSERLFFIHHQDQTQITYQPDKDHYTARSLVKNRVTMVDGNGQPLAGNFSVSVTSDREVTPDSTSSILTSLLLTSDLRGFIENPAYYFQNTSASAWALDLLMRTQGWRRYNIAGLTQGRFSRPSSPLEIGPEISGTVKSVLLGKPVEDIEVTVLASKANYFGNTKTNKDGRFYLRGGELPDSTLLLVSALPKVGMTRMELIIDRETFPERTLPALPSSGTIDKKQLAKYADKADRQYTAEFGVRMYQLSEITITAERKPPRTSPFYSSPSNSITEEELDKFPVTDIRTLLTLIPGVIVSGDNISIRGGGTPLLVVDDMTTDIEYLDMINVYDIAQVDVLKDAGNTAIFGSRGGNGVIVIFTREGKINPVISKPFHIKTIVPLGYQKPIEFYTPKYDTPEKQRKQNADLRTTIHWQPVVQIDSLGVASFDFYTADETASYTVTIEGLANNGTIIRQECKGGIRNE